jgi:hypothetical protein
MDHTHKILDNNIKVEDKLQEEASGIMIGGKMAHLKKIERGNRNDKQNVSDRDLLILRWYGHHSPFLNL